ncbi:MAG TPA: GntR family transcriptional regulator [Chthonomonadaceae bacterium]|nr:GntR family transcriptional regulator [Chthonomonadaceae bacterium]
MINKVDKKNPLPRYLQVKQLLETRIRTGTYRPGARLPGERDLAHELGVSQMTVNKGILAMVDAGWLYREQGKGTFISDGFHPPLPETLHIGVVSRVDAGRMLEDYYLGSLFRGMRQAVSDAPVMLSILGAKGFYSQPDDASLDGYLLVDPLYGNVPDIHRLLDSGKRLVAVSAAWPEMQAPFVDSDNVGGTRAAVEHLLNLGHRRIAGVFTLSASSNARDRLYAYEAVLAARSLCLPSDFTIATESSFSSAETRSDQVRSLLRRSDRPTAFFCAGYYSALETLDVIREAGQRVPEDVSLVAFDDPLSARHITPPLTTVSQPLDAMGRLATEKLLKWLTYGEQPKRQDILPTELVVRGSTMPPPGGV